ncbi:MAG: hypothetical protein HGA36_03300 [Candidatus Moranbacteria bacterium]|nr:hypothetical protein [Candidatus Moranbacteria bacterium]
MKRFFRKSALIGLLSIFSLFSLFGTSAIVSAKSINPSVNIVDKSSSTVTLSVKKAILDKHRVTIRVRVQEVATGEKFDRIFKVTLNKDGKKKVTLSKLLPNTSYMIKAQIKERGNEKYSNFSKFKEFSTRP